MKNCKYCNGIVREYRDQKDGKGKTFHVLECIAGCHRVVSYQSITNARKQWQKLNKVVRQDLYDNLISILNQYYNNEDLEKVIKAVRDYDNKTLDF